jgi:hypothetical protein
VPDPAGGVWSIASQFPRGARRKHLGSGLRQPETYEEGHQEMTDTTPDQREREQLQISDLMNIVNLVVAELPAPDALSLLRRWSLSLFMRTGISRQEAEAMLKLALREREYLRTGRSRPAPDCDDEIEF